MKLSASMMMFLRVYKVRLFFWRLAHINVGRVARTIAFEVMFQVGDIQLAPHVRSSKVSWNLLHP